SSGARADQCSDHGSAERGAKPSLHRLGGAGILLRFGRTLRLVLRELRRALILFQEDERALGATAHENDYGDQTGCDPGGYRRSAHGHVRETIRPASKKRHGQRPRPEYLHAHDGTGGDYPEALMTREEHVKAVGLKAGARVVGIAAVESFREKVPEGYRPEDILPGARSVVVAGGDGPTAGAWRCPDHRGVEITGYDLREHV